jgi:hypothetical protein
MGCNGKCACGGVEHNISIQPAYVNYCVVRGDAFADTITIKEPPTPGADPEPVDLTSPERTYTGQLRKHVNSQEVIYELDFDMTDAASGSFVISIPASITRTLTGEYHYDIEQSIAPSTGPRTILSGMFTFSPDVTR